MREEEKKQYRPLRVGWSTRIRLEDTHAGKMAGENIDKAHGEGREEIEGLANKMSAWEEVNVYICICMYVCMHVCMYVCMFV